MIHYLELGLAILRVEATSPARGAKLAESNGRAKAPNRLTIGTGEPPIGAS
jgi:hypothetical protein